MGSHRRLIWFIGWFLCVCVSMASAEPQRSGRNQVQVRGQSLSVYYIPARAPNPSQCKMLYAPGDGGWRGFGVTIAEQLAGTGCDVYGLDTKGYLQAFADARLSPADVAADYRSLVTWLRQGSTSRIYLAGWSEGAGLALAAAGAPGNHDLFFGVIAIGTTEHNILAWRWSDTMAELRKVLPNEPTFPSYDYVGRVAPLPLFMVASSEDEYVSVEMTRRLFDKAGQPKQLVILDASDHKFGGKTSEFYQTLGRAIQWISQNSSK